MKYPTTVLAVCLFGSLICDVHPVVAQTAVVATPAPIKGILAARRFTLETPFPYTWTRERIKVSSGTLVVLEVDPALVVPRNTLEPVLYAGNVPVQRLNHGNKSGRVVGIVPGSIDVTTSPIWFGTPQLPERITTAEAEAERARAEKANVAQKTERAKIADLDTPPVAARDLAELLRTVAADLVLTYSPAEKDLAESWRLPIARKPDKSRSD